MKKTKEQFIFEARKVHGDKYDYSKVVYINAHKKVCIICPKHGEFYQEAHSHLKGCGCRQCDNERKRNTKGLLDSHTMPFDVFVERATKVHNNKYTYDKDSYCGVTKKIKITCPIHGDFWQRGGSHLYGNGCILCRNEQSVERNLSTTEEFIEKAKNIHGDNKYDYSKVDYKSSYTKVIITCQKHGDFLQTPSAHLQGQGCPHCKKSRGEMRVKDTLLKLGIDFVEQYKIKNDTNFGKNKIFCVDFYLPTYNIIIEYNGEQHYRERVEPFHKTKLKNQKERDNALMLLCKNKGYTLIIIPYTEFDNIERIIKNKILYEKI